MAQNKVYEELNSFRGIAAILVALFHSPFVSGDRLPIIAQGEIFVDFFFVLSGFVIMHAYGNRIAVGLTMREFVIRRVARVYPLHLFMLLVFVPYILAKVVMFQYFGKGADPLELNNSWTFILNLGLLQTFGLTNELTWNYPSWSVGAEFYTYVLFFVGMKYLHPRWPGIFALASAIALGVLLVHVAVTGQKTLLLTYDMGLVRCIVGFALGAYLYQHIAPRVPAWSRRVSTALEILVLSCTLIAISQSSESIGWQLAAFAGFAAIISIFSQGTGLVSAVLRAKPLTILGTLSFSIYMLHALIFDIVGNVAKFILNMPVNSDDYIDSAFGNPINLALLVVVVALSYVTYRLVERPGQALVLDALPRRRQPAPGPAATRA